MKGPTYYCNLQQCQRKPKNSIVCYRKAKKSRAFKNLNMTTLRGYYRHQSFACIDSALFKEQFFDAFIPEAKKTFNICLLEVSCFLIMLQLILQRSSLKKNIKATFLPPHVTPLMHQLDHGVIKWLKKRYRKEYFGSLVEKSKECCFLFKAIKSLNIKEFKPSLKLAKKPAK